MAKDWTKKLHDAKGLPKVVPITGSMSKRWGTGTVAIPSPLEIDEAMRKVPKGKLTTINHLREYIAKKHHATIGCPITTGIFSWIAAHAADEQRQQGAGKITPYWRTLKTGGMLNEKYPGGVGGQQKFLKNEGHHITKKGKHFFVTDYENFLFKFLS